MKYIIGSGKNKMDWTYVGNVAQAHVQAADALELSSPLAGSAYFITNQDPRPFWGTIGDILDGLGYVRPSIRLPFALVYFLAFIAETVSWVLSPLVRIPVGNFTRPRITLSVCERQVSSDKARRDFGYVPEVSMAEGIKRTIAHFRAKGLAAVPGKRGSKKEVPSPPQAGRL